MRDFLYRFKLLFLARFLCISSKNARTGGFAETADAIIEASGVRMSAETSSSLRNTRCSPSTYRSATCTFGSSAATASALSVAAPLWAMG